jgi:hypothetical protein
VAGSLGGAAVLPTYPVAGVSSRSVTASLRSVQIPAKRGDLRQNCGNPLLTAVS